MIRMQLPTELQAIDASLIPQLWELYLLERVREGQIRDETVKSYTVQFAPFLQWFGARESKELSPALLGEFAHWLRHDYRTSRGERASGNTYAHALDRTRSFFKWAYKRNTVPVNMADWLPKPRAHQGRAHFPDIAELQALFDAFSGIERIRNWAILGLLISTGARLFEAANATTENVSFNTPLNDLRTSSDHSGTLWLRKVKFDADGEGEGRTVVFDRKGGLLIKVWLICNQNKPEDTIFGLTPDGIDKRLRAAAHTAGADQFHPHALRRAFSDFWDETHGLEAQTILKKQLGHSTKGDVTEDFYLRRNHNRIARAIAKWHVSPMERIVIDWKTLPVVCDE